jgi:uncharacterized protein (TIGR00255 family)
MSTKNNTTPQAILSMTGFANSETRFPAGLLLIELRAVNHRYLELNVKIEDSLRQFEALVREQLQSKLGRGKVECRLSLKSDSASSSKLALNPAMVTQIAQTLQDLHQHFPEAQPVNLVDIFKLPGVLQTEAVDSETLGHTVQSGLAQTIDELIAARQR